MIKWVAPPPALSRVSWRESVGAINGSSRMETSPAL